VRELGGLVTRPDRIADGHRVVACDDPEGAAFGLYEIESGTRNTSIT